MSVDFSDQLSLHCGRWPGLASSPIVTKAAPEKLRLKPTFVQPSRPKTTTYWQRRFVAIRFRLAHRKHTESLIANWTSTVTTEPPQSRPRRRPTSVSASSSHLTGLQPLPCLPCHNNTSRTFSFDDSDIPSHLCLSFEVRELSSGE